LAVLKGTYARLVIYTRIRTSPSHDRLIGHAVNCNLYMPWCETVRQVDTEERILLLERAMTEVRKLPAHYDDVLREVSARIDVSGSVGKSDIAVLAFWKRIRSDSWAESFLS
jgi:hypothetical protein